MPAPEPVGFTDRQLDQIRALLAEQDSERREELRMISSKLDMIASSLEKSATTLSSDLHRIFESLNVVAEGSRVYLDATGQLRRDIDFAIDQIGTLIEGFKKSQKDEIMEMIGHLKRIVYKHT